MSQTCRRRPSAASSPVFRHALLAILLLHVLLTNIAQAWSSSDDGPFDRVDRQPIHALRHHHDRDAVDYDADLMVTQGPRAVRSGQHNLQHNQPHNRAASTASAPMPTATNVPMRHHNHRGRHVSTRAPPTKAPSPPPPEEHRLRHSQKLYKPYALIESRELDLAAASAHRHVVRPLPAQRPTIAFAPHRQRHHGGAQQPSLFNVTSAMQRRLFDRDALYSRRNAVAKSSTSTSTTTTTTSTTTTPPPSTSTTTEAVRMRHSGSAHRTKPFLNTYDRYDDPYLNRAGSNRRDSANDAMAAAAADDDDDEYYDDYEDDDDDIDAQSQAKARDQQQRQHATERSTARAPSTRSMLRSSSNKNNDDYGYGDGELDDEDDDVIVRPSNRAGQRENYTDEDDTEAKSYIPGTLTEHKLRTLGTSATASNSHRQYKINEERASEHIMRISQAVTCRVPRPRVIPVQTNPAQVSGGGSGGFGGSGKQYIPHCTILHRCGDDAGCCSSDARTCAAKTQQMVDLYFFVSSSGSRQGTIEKLSFVNHTECHCVQRQPTQQQPQPQEIRIATVISCTCPTLYEKVLQADGTCRCDCSSGNQGCDSKKRGHEHFSVQDRKCIEEARCKLPTCEYGTYNKALGRCARKEDKLRRAFGN